MSDYYPEMPPELRKIIEKIKSFRGFKGQGGFLVLIILIVLLVVAAYTVFYTIAPNEAGVILRFGRYVGTTGPGLHLKLPYPVDKVFKVQVTTIRKEEFGFRTKKAGVVTRYAKGNEYDEESLMLTGDLNVGDVEWVVQFKVDDPYKYLFRVRDPRKNLRDVSESVMRLIVGDRSVSDVLTVGREAIAEEVKKKMQEIYDHYGMGITVTNVMLQDVNPPDMVKASFNEVNEAKQEQEKMVNQAWKQYNHAIPEAKGKAEQTIAVAEGYALERINNAKGEANRFLSVFGAYLAAPQVTRTRIYVEKMEEILGRAEKVFIMDPQAKAILPHINLREFQPEKGGAE